jgi:FkbM family methyltransferase
MNLNDLTCRAYLGLRELKIAGILRRIPGVMRPIRRLLRILLPSKPVWVQVRSGMSQGMWMRLNLRKEARLWRGEHELTLQGALRAAVIPGAVVYDIGAHAGSIALGVARLVGPNGHVVAFEADPQNAENLRENRDRNHLTATLRIVSSAVWSYSSSGISFRCGGEKRSHGGVEMDGQHPVLGSGELIDVPAVTLDDFVANGGPIPQLVKIDVEGGEYDVLRGGEDLFSTQRPLIVAEVHHKQAADRIGPWLIEHQYSSRWVAPVEKFPCCLFAWPETYRGSGWMWTSGTDNQV